MKICSRSFGFSVDVQQEHSLSAYQMDGRGFAIKQVKNKKYHPELNIFSLCNSSLEFSVVLLHAKLPFMADGSV